MRALLSRTLVDLAERNARVVFLTSKMGKDGRTPAKYAWPCGVLGLFPQGWCSSSGI